MSGQIYIEKVGMKPRFSLWDNTIFNNLKNIDDVINLVYLKMESMVHCSFPLMINDSYIINVIFDFLPELPFCTINGTYDKEKARRICIFAFDKLLLYGSIVSVFSGINMYVANPAAEYKCADTVLQVERVLGAFKNDDLFDKFLNKHPDTIIRQICMQQMPYLARMPKLYESITNILLSELARMSWIAPTAELTQLYGVNSLYAPNNFAELIISEEPFNIEEDYSTTLSHKSSTGPSAIVVNDATGKVEISALADTTVPEESPIKTETPVADTETSDQLSKDMEEPSVSISKSEPATKQTKSIDISEESIELGKDKGMADITCPQIQD